MVKAGLSAKQGKTDAERLAYAEATKALSNADLDLMATFLKSVKNVYAQDKISNQRKR